MILDPTFTVGWVVILAVGLAWEVLALLKRRRKPGEPLKPDGTLTWNIRTWLQLGSRAHWIGRLALAGALAWLNWHFLFPVPVVNGTPASPQGGSTMFLGLSLAALLAAVKSWAIRIAVGYATKIAVDEIRKAAPGLWAKVPDLAKPVVTTVLGAVTAAVTGDPTALVADAVGGAIGGAAGKVVHDAQKENDKPKAPQAGPDFLNPVVPQP